MIPFQLGSNKVSVDIRTNKYNELHVFKEKVEDCFFKDKPVFNKPVVKIEDPDLYAFAQIEDRMLSLFKIWDINKKVATWRETLEMNLPILYKDIKKYITREWDIEDYRSALYAEKRNMTVFLTLMAAHFKKHVVKDKTYIRYKSDSDDYLFYEKTVDEKSGYNAFIVTYYKNQNLNLPKCIVKDLKTIADTLGICTKGLLKADLVTQIDHHINNT